MMKLESWDTEANKALWKIVRLDDYSDVPGKIISACVLSGECVMQINGGQSQNHSFGAGGIRIMPNRRR